MENITRNDIPRHHLPLLKSEYQKIAGYPLLIIILLITMLPLPLFAEDHGAIIFGVKAMFGGRYDDMRMCVASDTGVKGGTVADVMLLTQFRIKEKTALNIEIPVMRPILFAAAFDMLQFEPEVTVEFSKKLSDNTDMIFGPGIGASFHYGPDYHSNNKENRGESFFAAGPLVSTLYGFRVKKAIGKANIFGIRAFYIPLFSRTSDLSPGTVVGGVLEAHLYF